MTSATSGTLIYRASRDGFHASAFHAKCDGKAKTVTIIKTKTNYVFGGYTSAAWSSTGGWVLDGTAYLFRFRSNDVSIYNKYGVYASIMSNTHYYAIHSSSEYGPTFGGLYRWNYGLTAAFDIKTPTRPDVESGTCTQNSYGVTSTVLAGSTTWSTSDIEVFQV